jgi:hypothetical protein
VSDPLFCNQCATSSPLASRTTEGTSAQFTNQSVPEETSRGADQPVAVRSAKRSVAFWPSRSTQLRSCPCAEAESCGCALFGPAGERSGSIETAQGTFAPAWPLTVPTVVETIRVATRTKRRSILSMIGHAAELMRLNGCMDVIESIEVRYR